MKKDVEKIIVVLDGDQFEIINVIKKEKMCNLVNLFIIFIL